MKQFYIVVERKRMMRKGLKQIVSLCMVASMIATPAQYVSAAEGGAQQEESVLKISI